MADRFDDLLRAADKGAPIGTTQRYFKSAPPPAVAPAPVTAPPPTEPLRQGGESEKEMIDRILGRKKQSMSDAPGELAAGQQYAKADAETPTLPPTKKGAPDRIETLENVRRLYPAYANMPDLELGNALASKYPDAYGFLKVEVPRGEGDKATGPTTPESIAGAVLNPGQPRPLTTTQKIGNAVLPPLVAAPTIAAGGELVPAAPAVGRAFTSGLFGGVKAASEGKGPSGIAWDAVVDGLLGGATEAGVGLATRLKIPFTGMPSLKEAGEKVPGAAKGFARGTESLDKALDAIRDRLPKGKWLNVPTLGDKKMTVDEAVAGLKKLTGDDFKQARGEVVSELTRLDMQRGVKGARGPTPYAGQAFNLRATPERFVYKGTPGERAATRTLDVLRNPGVRAGLDAEGVAESVAPGVPNALLPALLMEGATFSELARHARPKL